MSKFFKFSGVVLILSFALSGLSTSAYANEDDSSKQSHTDTLLTTDNTDSTYDPARPNKETSTKDESDNNVIELSRKELVNVQYPAFSSKVNSRYSFNPNTNPLVRLDQKYVDQYIEKLEECHEYDETNGYCFNDDTSRYILGVDTSTYDASKFDLLRFAQDIEKTSGKKTIVYTGNHYSTSGDKLKWKQILMFSDHVKLAEELSEYKAKVFSEVKSEELFRNVLIAGSVLVGIAILITVIGLVRKKTNNE